MLTEHCRTEEFSAVMIHRNKVYQAVPKYFYCYVITNAVLNNIHT